MIRVSLQSKVECNNWASRNWWRLLSIILPLAFCLCRLTNLLDIRIDLEIISIHVRIKDITNRESFRDDDFSAISPLQIYTSWFDTLKERGFHIFYFFKSGIVVFPHAAIVLVGIVLFILNETGLIKLAQK